MQPDQNIATNQIQKLTLTQDLRQSLTILQMPLGELKAFISQQLFENCLLEQDEVWAENNGEEIDYLEPLSLDDLTNKDIVIYDPKNDNDYWLDQTFYDESAAINYNLPKNTYECVPTRLPSLQEQLIAQLSLASPDKHYKNLAEFLIGNIDEDGYLRCEIKDVAGLFKTTPAEVETSLHLIQTFEPYGVGARDLAECLLLQLELKNDDLIRLKGVTKERLQLAKAIITGYLSDMASGKLSKITARLKYPITEVQAAINIIKTFDPKPGRNYGAPVNTQFIIPDVTIRLMDNEYVIIINEPSNTRLFINPVYRQFIGNPACTDLKVLEYLKEKQNAALNLIRSINQRKLTLYQITQAIIKVQCEFLEQGPLYLKPLTLHQVAEMVELHESTVSRAIADKYIDTQRGIYPMKYFFNSGLNSTTGEAVSAESVKKQIKTILDHEDSQNPLSDQQLAGFLKEKGIAISRRTVTKYREEMLIPASAQRRRYQ